MDCTSLGVCSRTYDSICKALLMMIFYLESIGFSGGEGR